MDLCLNLGFLAQDQCVLAIDVFFSL